MNIYLDYLDVLMVKRYPDVLAVLNVYLYL